MTKQELLVKIQQTVQRKAITLNLSHKGLTELPPEFEQLTQLLVLDLSYNQLTQLPSEIGQLTQLRWLFLDSNQLTQLIPELGQLTHLQRLYLNRNQLTQLPSELGQLTQLQRLYLNHNQLTQLPPELGQLTQLQKLYLNYNGITQLPPELGQLTQLRMLGLKDNPISLPPEILKQDRPWDILNYYFNNLWAGSRPLHEAKILLVGQGGVGKTSLVNRLLCDTYNEQEGKTEGIAINQWSVASATGDIRLNIWDFGGQEIMHATHQFFLTKRSLYLLVLDARQGEQESRVEYWLKLIQSFGGESPVLVIVNKSDEHRLDINRKGLQSKYESIKGFFNISCKTGKGLKELKPRIQSCINELPHVHDDFPANWFSIKNQLGNMTEDYLSYEEYQKMCQREGITDDTSQRTLIGFLHDLGIALNFRDSLHPQLDTNILNPEWVTKGVYSLLNNRTLANRQGVLDMEKLNELLDSHRYPVNKQHLIIDIMEKFELCFAFDEQRRQFLIPELLPKEEPDLSWDNENSLRFEYHYDVLPSSIMSRFIVRLHDKIWKKTYWHTGVVLTHDNNKSLIKADIEDKKIFIWITGNVHGKRALLGIIRFQFEQIHQSISKIQVREQVPYKNIVISYDDLLDLEENGIKKHYYPSVKEEVDIVELLSGITDKKTRSEEMRKLENIESELKKIEKTITRPTPQKNIRLVVEIAILLGLIIYFVLSSGLGTDPTFSVIISIASGIISGYIANRL
jgi:internalin A